MEYRNIVLSRLARLSVRQQQLVIEQEETCTVPIEDLSSVLIEPFRPIVDLYVAQNVSEPDSGLSQTQKIELFHLTNVLVKQAGKQFRVMLSMGRICTALANSITEQKMLLELLELLPLEQHRYE